MGSSQEGQVKGLEGVTTRVKSRVVCQRVQ